MAKKCKNCGKMLPENASFCPYCTAVQEEKQEVTAPKRWRKKGLCILLGALIVLLGGVAALQYHKPQTLEGGASLQYSDKGSDWYLMLSFSVESGITEHVQGEQSETIAEGMWSALPCQLYVFDKKTGKLAWEEFTEKVASCEVETVPEENARKMEYVEPVHNESFPDAAYVSDINYTADCGTNEIRWTLKMKNGDTISMKYLLHITKLDAVTYYPEDTKMDTEEDLQALLTDIKENVAEQTVVFLYLPPVTYEGDFAFENHTFAIYGGNDAEGMTTFTGTVMLKSNKGQYTDVNGIQFRGNGGTGLKAYSMTTLNECSFEGWDVGADAENGSWIGAMNCTFEGNKIGMQFNTSSSSGTSAAYLNNTFRKNGTAVQINSLPGTEVLDFSGCVFSGNETDIENRDEHPVDTTGATFDEK